MAQSLRPAWSAALLVLLLAAPALIAAAPSDPRQQQIFAVENALSGAGYSIDSADGSLDDSTREALRSFQQEWPGLTVSGEIDDATLIALGVKRENSGYDREAAKKAAQQVKPSYDPTQDAAPAGKAGSGEDTPVAEEDEGWLFSW